MYVPERQMYVPDGHRIICQVKILDSVTIAYRYTCIHVYSLNINNALHDHARQRGGHVVKYIKLLLSGVIVRRDRMYLHYYI